MAQTAAAAKAQVPLACSMAWLRLVAPGLAGVMCCREEGQMAGKGGGISNAWKLDAQNLTTRRKRCLTRHSSSKLDAGFALSAVVALDVSLAEGHQQVEVSRWRRFGGRL